MHSWVRQPIKSEGRSAKVPSVPREAIASSVHSTYASIPPSAGLCLVCDSYPLN